MKGFSPFAKAVIEWETNLAVKGKRFYFVSVADNSFMIKI